MKGQTQAKNEFSKLAEIELLKAKDMAEAASRAGIVVCEASWKVKDMNATARKFLGIQSAAVTGMDFWKLITSGYTTSLPPETIRDISKSRKTFDLIRPETEKNKSLYLQVNMEVVHPSPEKVSGIVMSLQDVTEIRKEEFLKRDFLSLISHKLRTPVSVILESAGMLLDGLLGEISSSQKTALSTIARQSQQLHDSVEKLLGFVTVEKEKLDLPPESLNLRKQFSDLTSTLVQNTKIENAKVILDCPEDAILSMNKTYFDLIFGNLIDNALKFRDKKPLELCIRVKKTSLGTIIVVSDNGPGIPPEETEKIFDKFYQVDKDFTGNVQGVGLGLVIVKRLTEMHKGKVSVKSKLGEGAEFTVFLPIV